MDWFVKEAIEIRLHPNNINREEGFKLGIPYPSTRLLRYFNAHRPGKSQEENTGKSVLKRRQTDC
jgi:hypothetical protein